MRFEVGAVRASVGHICMHVGGVAMSGSLSAHCIWPTVCCDPWRKSRPHAGVADAPMEVEPSAIELAAQALRAPGTVRYWTDFLKVSRGVGSYNPENECQE